jgi:peptidoglycan L-alanyl-D-glutamate endopeptidase CwlK
VISSRKIDDLAPSVAIMCQNFIHQCAAAGIDILITCTYRDKECQDALYDQGRTKPGIKVTNVAGGYSFHNWRVAFDFVPLVNGKAVWDDVKLWEDCGDIAVRCGLEWGGNWHGFVDRPHCQFTSGFDIADFQSGAAVVA